MSYVSKQNADSQGSIDGKEIIGKIEKGPRGREYARTADGRNWSRQGEKPWTLVEAVPTEIQKESIILAVTRQKQEGKKPHWAIFVGPEGGKGTVYQVTGIPF